LRRRWRKRPSRWANAPFGDTYSLGYDRLSAGTNPHLTHQAYVVADRAMLEGLAVTADANEMTAKPPGPAPSWSPSMLTTTLSPGMQWTV
jgi:hypothetical protein